jgi:hypothetical protein
MLGSTFASNIFWNIWKMVKPKPMSDSEVRITDIKVRSALMRVRWNDIPVRRVDISVRAVESFVRCLESSTDALPGSDSSTVGNDGNDVSARRAAWAGSASWFTGINRQVALVCADETAR